MFKNEGHVQHFPRGQNKYNIKEDIVKVVERASNRDVGGIYSGQQTRLEFCIGLFGSILFDHQPQK